MKTIVFNFALLLAAGSAQAADKQITLNDQDIIAVSRTFDAGDVGGTLIEMSLPTKTVVYRDGLLKVKVPSAPDEFTMTLEKTEVDSLFRQRDYVFNNLTIQNFGPFPCTGVNKTSSAGMPVTNYFIYVKFADIGKVTTMANGTVATAISIPSSCIDERSRRHLDEFFEGIANYVFINSK